MGKDRIEGVTYARLEYGGTSYLIQHRKDFDRQFMKAVEFDGRTLKEAVGVAKHLVAIGKLERMQKDALEKQ